MKIDTSRPFCTCANVEGLGRFAMMVTALFAAAPGPASAGGDSHRQEGVTLRLVALAPDAQGRVRGALSIDLEPGWKTYWVAPGPVGLPPRLDLSGSTGVTDPAVAFPAPVRFAEGQAQSVGYVGPVAFPIAARAVPGASPTLRVDAFLGICRELCVPVQAALTAAPTSSLSDVALVRHAEAALPTENDASPPPLRWSADGDALLIGLPNGDRAPTDAFVSAGEGWSFGEPIAASADAGSALAVPVLTRPGGAATPETADILLTRAESAQLFRAVPIAPR